MSVPSPLYVPVLPLRHHARLAYRDLAPEVRAALAPLWNVPAFPGAPPATLREASWKDELTGLMGEHGGHPGWIDAPFAEEAHVPELAALVAECAGLFSPLRPVTGPDRSPAQRSAALAMALQHDCGVGVRVRVPGEWHGDTAEGVQDVLTRLGPGVPVDLLLDLGGVLAGRPDAAKEALRALDALWPLAEWRTAAVLSGGFPQLKGDLLPWETPHREPRTDWRMWQELRAGDRDYLPLLSYGDYGVQPTSALARPPGGGSPPWDRLRYTTEDSFVICKVPKGGPHHVARVRAAARRICELPDFRGASAGFGETWLRNCAQGPTTSSEGVGNPTVRLKAGNAQHLTYVARSLHSH